MTAVLDVCALPLTLGALFAASGQLLALALGHTPDLNAWARHSGWLACAILLAAAFLREIA